jgi:hypothetical protein
MNRVTERSMLNNDRELQVDEQLGRRIISSDPELEVCKQPERYQTFISDPNIKVDELAERRILSSDSELEIDCVLV